MSRIAVVTDTNSSITKEEAKKLGIYLLPMPFIVDGKEYFEGVTCTYEQFFEMLAGGADVSTSQPSPESITGLWDEILKTHDSIVHIPMSSALSGSCGTAKALAADYNGRVCVVDNKRISGTQRESVVDALTLIDKGLTAAEICVQLEATALNASIYLAVNTLELLKKSGRVTPAGAALATLLGLKPVLQIQGEKLDAFAKVRGWKAAKKTMLKAIEADLSGRFADVKEDMILGMAYTCSREEAQEWKKEIQERFPGYEMLEGPLSLSVACHIGPGAMAVTCMKKI